MGEKQFRRKITWFSFLFSLLVVWVHSYNAELYLGKTESMRQVSQFEHLLGDGLGQIAVPGFFMISGYLFYRDLTWQRLPAKWHRRIRSVLVPYILWNFLYYLGYVVGSRMPWLHDVVGKGVVPFTLQTAADAVIHYTYNYVFWYLYQLMLLILLAPVLYLLLRKRWSRVGTLLALWILIVMDVRLPLVNADALFYYSMAASFGLARESLSGERTGGMAGVGLIIVSLAANGLGMRLGRPWCAVLCRVTAVIGLWSLVPGELLPEPPEWASHSFFLYATHFALVRLINKAGAMVLPGIPAIPVFLYLAMPVLTLAVSTALGRCLHRFSPAAWSLLNGGRQ